MDENKELLGVEDAEKETVLDTDTEDSAAFEEAEKEENEEVLEAEDNALAEDEQSASAKKKSFLMKPIIISAVIVGCAVVLALVLRLFFNSSIEGTWRHVRSIPLSSDSATDDEVEPLEIEYYYDFGKDGTVTSTIGNVSSTGTYKTYKNEDGQTLITIEVADPISTYYLSDTYVLKVSGNAFTGRKLTLTGSSENSSEVYEFESEKYNPPQPTREGDFTPNEKLVGTWVYNDEPYHLTYEFTNDGKAFYREEGIRANPYTGAYINVVFSMNGIYDYTDKNITVSYFFTKETTMDIDYELDGDILKINGFDFVREGAATKD